MFLNSGKSWSKVQKVFKDNESYEIETQNAVAIVRGTSFGVYIKNGTTYLVVSEGSVFFVPVDKNTRERFLNRGVIVTASKKAYIDKNGNVVLGPITEMDTKDSWYIYNNKSDILLPTATSSDSQIKKSYSNYENNQNQNKTYDSYYSSPGGGGGGSSSISIRSFSPILIYVGDRFTVSG